MEAEKKANGIAMTAENRKKFLEAFETMQECLFRINEDKGWHSPEPSDAECVANIHGEISELNEWMRQGDSVPSDHIAPFTGVEEEGADAVIRIMNWFKRRGWRLAEAILAKAEYNSTRPHRHGGKKF